MFQKSLKYYIVSGLSVEVKSFDGSVITPKGVELWFGKSDGYYTLTRGKLNAHKFKERPNLDELAKWDGMPWYNRLQFGSARIFEINEEVTRRYSEKEVT